MKRIIVFKERKGYIGIFSEVPHTENIYEIPIQKQLSYLFKDKFYNNVTVKTSNSIHIIDNMGGNTVGELDGLVLSQNEGMIFPIEIKNRNIGNFTKKYRIMLKMMYYILKWQFKNHKKICFNFIVPIWFFREEPPDRERLAEKYKIVILTQNDLKKLREEFKKKHKLDLDNIHKFTGFVKSQIPPERSIHPILIGKISAVDFIPVHKIFDPLDFGRKTIDDIISDIQ